MKTLNSIFRSSKFKVLADQGLFSGTNFVVTIALAKILSPTDFGLFCSIVLAAYLFISIGNALILQPFQVSGQKRQNSVAYSHFLFFCQLGFSLVVVAGSGLACGLMQAFPFSLWVAALFISALLMHDFARKFYLAKNALQQVLIIDALVALGQIATVALPVQNKSLNTLLLILGCSYLPALAFFSYHLKPVFRTAGYWGRFFQSHKREGKWLGLVSFIQWGSGNLLIACAGLFIGLQALGAFRLVQSLFGVLNILFQAFENYVLPAASRLHSKSTTEARNYLRKTGLQSALVIGSVLLVLFLFSDKVIDLASAGKYSAYGYVVKGMCLLYFIIFVGYPVRLGVRLLLLNRSFFTGYLLSFCFSAVFLSALLRHWQINGIIAGLIVNQVIMTSFWVFQLNKQKFYLWK